MFTDYSFFKKMLYFDPFFHTALSIFVTHGPFSQFSPLRRRPMDMQLESLEVICWTLVLPRHHQRRHQRLQRLQAACASTLKEFLGPVGTPR